MNKLPKAASVLVLLALLSLTGCIQQVDRVDFANLGVDHTVEPPPPTATLEPPTPTPTETPIPEPTEPLPPTPTPVLDIFVDILEPPEGVTVLGRNLTVGGMTNVGNSIAVNGNRIEVNAGGEFTTVVSLSVGANVIEVLATNIQGEQQREFLTVTYIQPSPPPFFLLVTEPADQILVADQIIQVAGKTVPQATITVNGVGVRVDEEGDFSTLVRLSPGPNPIEVLARNTDGRILNADRRVHYSP